MARPLAQSSVELEFRVQPELFRLLTTTDGSIGPLLGDHPVPDFLAKIGERKRVQPDGISKMPFDWLSDPQKLELINLSKGRVDKHEFFANRTIRGLTTRDTVELNFAEPTRFLGKDYAAGTHTIDVSQYLQKHVEFGSPEDLVNPIGTMELHLRGELPASEMVESAWALEAGIGIERRHKHAHITAPVPWEKLERKPGTTAVLMTDFHRRTNLAAEMLAIVEDKIAISRNAGDGYTNFGALTSQQLKNLFGDWRKLGRRGKSHAVENPFRTQYKISYVGMRGPGFYDDLNVWGEEVRSLTRRTSSRNSRALLDAIQEQMDTAKYLDFENRIQRWIARGEEKLGSSRIDKEVRKLTGELEGDLLYRAHYQKQWGELVVGAPARIRREFSWLVKKTPPYAKWNDEVKMLFHDWSFDPLFFDRPEKAAEIVNRQVHALRRLARREGSVNEIMKEFLITSGIYREVLESVGMRVRYKITSVR